MGTTSKRDPIEFRKRAGRLLAARQGQGSSQWAAIGQVSSKLGCRHEALIRQEPRAQRPSVGYDY